MTTDNLMRRCSSCKQEKTTDNFNKNQSKKDGLSCSCKECHRQFSRKNYENNKAITMQRNKLTHERIRLALMELRKGPCSDCCGIFDPFVMEFDHRDPATKVFSMANYGTRSLKRVKEELAKCDLVCANCHKLRTRKLSAYGPHCSLHLKTLPSEGSTLSI